MACLNLRVEKHFGWVATSEALVKSETKEDVNSSGHSNDRARSRGNTRIDLKRRKLAEGNARAREQDLEYMGLADSSDEEEVIMSQPQPPDAKVEAEGKEYMGLKVSLSEVRSTVDRCSKVTKERSP